MADEAISTFANAINDQLGAIAKEHVKTNGSTIKPGYAVNRVGETFATKDVALITNSTFDTCAGIVGDRPDLDIDTAFADNLMVPFWRLGCNETVWCFLKTSAVTAVYPGMPLYAPVGGGGALDVLIRPLTTANATATWAAQVRYQKNAQTYVGISEDQQDVSSSGWTVIRVRLTGVGGGPAGAG